MGEKLCSRKQIVENLTDEVLNNLDYEKERSQRNGLSLQIMEFFPP